MRKYCEMLTYYYPGIKKMTRWSKYRWRGSATADDDDDDDVVGSLSEKDRGHAQEWNKAKDKKKADGKQEKLQPEMREGGKYTDLSLSLSLSLRYPMMLNALVCLLGRLYVTTHAHTHTNVEPSLSHSWLNWHRRHKSRNNVQIVMLLSVIAWYIHSQRNRAEARPNRANGRESEILCLHGTLRYITQTTTP